MTIDNSGTNPYDTDTDIPMSAPPSNAQSGDSGGIMAVWALNRESKLNTLVTGSYTNQSSYPLPNAIVDTTGYDVGFESSEMSLETAPNTTTLGDGGSDMLIWSLNRESQIDTLVTGSYTNQSSYSLPNAIVDTIGYDVGYKDSETSFAEPPQGVTLGANYFDLLIQGLVSAAPPGFEDANPVPVTDADLVAEKDGVTYTSTPKGDGTYDLSVGDFGTWTVTATREYLSDASITVEVTSPTEANQNLTLGFPSSGLSVEEGVDIG